MSPTSAAVYIMFTEIGDLTFAVPSILASGSMMVGSKYYGEGRYAELIRVLRFYTGFALFCAALFTALVASSRNMVPTLFANEVDLGEFQTLAETAYTIGILQQPFRAIIAVYGPLLMTTQNHALWGFVVSVLFLFVWSPFVIMASVLSDVRLLVAANAAFDAAHVCVIAGFMHFNEIPKFKELARLGVADTEKTERQVTPHMADSQTHDSTKLREKFSV
jgi:Na+-driven multidrug efflux pump